MAKSSYDYLFAKKPLKWLLTDYFAMDGHRGKVSHAEISSRPSIPRGTRRKLDKATCQAGCVLFV